MYAVEVRNLTRTFKEKKARNGRNGNGLKTALDNVNLTINKGELFGVLGPNGAGKTTMIKILATLLLPSSGEAYIHGLDVAKQPEKVRRIMNMVSGGEHSGYGILNVSEHLWMFSQFYGIPAQTVRERMEYLLKVLKLDEFRKAKISHLSTGNRQKMNLIRGFLSEPQVLFLDEPTVGLDVNIAREVRSFVKSWLNERREHTLLLTTHYMAEADLLCDRVAIIDRGKVLACDTPANLKRGLQQESIFHLEVDYVENGWEQLKALEFVKNFTVDNKASQNRSVIKLILKHDSAVGRVTELVEQKGAKVHILSKLEPTLEDVFIDMVGKGLEDENRA